MAPLKHHPMLTSFSLPRITPSTIRDRVARIDSRALLDEPKPMHLSGARQKEARFKARCIEGKKGNHHQAWARWGPRVSSPSPSTTTFATSIHYEWSAYGVVLLLYSDLLLPALISIGPFRAKDSANEAVTRCMLTPHSWPHLPFFIPSRRDQGFLILLRLRFRRLQLTRLIQPSGSNQGTADKTV
jgi:hypothetical protein